jgi:predicted RNA-binding protein (virulence factor B family)
MRLFDTHCHFESCSAEEIAERFGVSKKTFKRAVGTLYRNREITIEESGITLTAPKSETKTAE